MIGALVRLRVAAMLAVAVLAGCGGGGDSEQPAPYQPKSGVSAISLAPIAQQTQMWCWAAAAEMVLRHYGLPALLPNYQCGIVSVYYGPASVCWSNCFLCPQAIGTASELQKVVNGYGVVASQFFFIPSRILSSQLLFSALPFSEMAREIDSGRPIIAGISPGSFSYPNISSHAVVIVGYRNDSTGQFVIVNDPFPYDQFPLQPNPWLLAGATRNAPGQFSLRYDIMVQQMQWGNTLYQIQ